MATHALASTIKGGAIQLQSTDSSDLYYNEITVPSTAVSGDVVQLLPVKNTLVEWVLVKIKTAGAGATVFTANIGDGDDADGYDAAIDLTAAAGTTYRTEIGIDAYGAKGKVYGSTPDTINATLTITGGTPTAFPVLQVWAKVNLLIPTT